MPEQLRSERVTIPKKVKPAPGHVGNPMPQDMLHGRTAPQAEEAKAVKFTTGHQRGIGNLSGFTHGQSDNEPKNPATAGTEKNAKSNNRKIAFDDVHKEHGK